VSGEQRTDEQRIRDALDLMFPEDKEALAALARLVERLETLEARAAETTTFERRGEQLAAAELALEEARREQWSLAKDLSKSEAERFLAERQLVEAREALREAVVLIDAMGETMDAGTEVRLTRLGIPFNRTAARVRAALEASEKSDDE